MIRHSTYILMIALLAVLVIACSGKRSDMLRVSSPDNRLVAVMTRDDTGGTAISSEYDVYLNPINDAGAADRPVLIGTRCENMALTWEGQRSLQISYDSACVIRRFVNRWYEKAQDTKGQTPYIEILLSKR